MEPPSIPNGSSIGLPVARLSPQGRRGLDGARLGDALAGRLHGLPLGGTTLETMKPLGKVWGFPWFNMVHHDTTLRNRCSSFDVIWLWENVEDEYNWIYIGIFPCFHDVLTCHCDFTKIGGGEPRFILGPQGVWRFWPAKYGGWYLTWLDVCPTNMGM